MDLVLPGFSAGKSRNSMEVSILGGTLIDGWFISWKNGKKTIKIWMITRGIYFMDTSENKMDDN